MGVFHIHRNCKGKSVEVADVPKNNRTDSIGSSVLPDITMFRFNGKTFYAYYYRTDSNLELS